MRYPAIIDKSSEGDYGLRFPDIAGIVAMGATIDDVLTNAREALHDAYIELSDLPAPSRPDDIEVGAGEILAIVPLIKFTGKNRRANITLDEGALKFIDSECERLGVTRTAYLNGLVQNVAGE